MAKRAPKIQPSESLLKLVLEAPAAKPTISAADKNYLKGLVKRGYTIPEILAIGKKHGFTLTAEEMTVKPRKPKAVAVVAPPPHR
jgi:hypothetical protein